MIQEALDISSDTRWSGLFGFSPAAFTFLLSRGGPSSGEGNDRVFGQNESSQPVTACLAGAMILFQAARYE
jgi:hypothetical protein